MNRRFLTGLLISVFLSLIINECYAWPEPPDIYISDWILYTEVGNSVDVVADVYSGGPIYYWDWEWPGELNGTYDEYSYSSTATVWSNTPGQYQVDVEGEDEYGQYDSDYAWVYVIDVDIDTPSSFPAYVELGNDLALGCTSYGATSGTYNWTSSGPGTVTFSPSASAEDPDFSADQSGNYTVKVEYTKEEATASDTSGTIKVVKVTEVISSKDVACIGENVTFGAITDPLNCGHLVTVTWSGGGTPPTGSGSQFTTNWSTPGTKTVTATCGDSDEQKNVDIVEVKDVTFSPTALCADGSSTSTASATITPGTRTITWSIQGAALGCSINSSTGVITAGTTAGTITVRAADSVLSGCYSEANIDVVEVQDVKFSPTALCADGSSTSTTSATITPDTRTITWSIQGAALGCSINSSTGVITAGTTGGTITVRAADSVLSGCCAEADIDVVKVENVTFNPEDLYADGTSTSTASATITPSSRTITWSIEGAELGCNINSSTGVITAGTTEGTITVRAADSVLSGCYAEANIDILDQCLQTEAGSWNNMSVGEVNDECGNTLTLTFNSNVYCYYYNGLKVGNCPYLGGVNIIGYWKTTNEKRFYQTYHKSMDDKNDGSAGDEGDGDKKYDSVIWRYDCISDTGPSKTGIEHPTVMGGDDGTGSDFEELYCPPI